MNITAITQNTPEPFTSSVINGARVMSLDIKFIGHKTDNTVSFREGTMKD